MFLMSVFALLAASLPGSSAKSATAPSAVHLTSDGADADIGKMTDDAEFAAIEFFAPWCPHCQNFGPTWETVAAYFNKGEGAGGSRPTPRVTVFSIDCVAERDMCHDFHIRGYPTALFGTLAQFKAEKAKENAGALTKLGINTAKNILDAIGKETGGSYALESARDTAETEAKEERDAAARENARKNETAGDSRNLPHADLRDIAVATIRAYHEMTSPALLRPESRDAFVAFVELLASSHPLRACADASKRVVRSFDDSWPAEDGDMDGVRARLSKVRICGDEMREMLGVASDREAIDPNDPDAIFRDERLWRSCAGSAEGKRGYTCGLWNVFHALAARAPAVHDGSPRRGVPLDAATPRDTGGSAWFASVTGWIEHFFPCDECRSHFMTMASEAVGAEAVVTSRDAQLWAWKTHNRVNARLAEREARGEATGSGDPAFPKTQWPDSAACPGCRAPAGAAGKNGENASWDEAATVNFLTSYFHGVGAPRLEIGSFGTRREEKARAGNELVGIAADDGFFSPRVVFAFCGFAFLAFGVRMNPFASGNARRAALLLRGGKGGK